MNAAPKRYRLQEIYPPPLCRFLSGVSTFAASQQVSVAVVGGPVRDWLLGFEPREIDLMVGGDALRFGSELVRRWRDCFPDLPEPSVKRRFERFGTMKIALVEPISSGVADIDFASARTERYPRPGRAPEVTYPCSMEEDLERRDFTANAMALRIRGDEAELLDPFAGADAVFERVLHVLHDRSFHDDPARLIRAVRFRNRLQFQLGVRTGELFHEALAANYLELLTPQRRFDEFRKALNEPELVNLLELMEAEGMLARLFPDAVFHADAIRPFDVLLPGDERQAKVLGSLFADVPSAAFESRLKEWGLSKKLAGEYVRWRGDVG